MEKKNVSLIVSENHQVIIKSDELEFAYIRNIFESKNLYQVMVVIKGCHDVEPFKEGLVVASHDTLDEAKESLNKLIKGMIDTTGIEVVQL
jgi:hypothetical protein